MTYKKRKLIRELKKFEKSLSNKNKKLIAEAFEEFSKEFVKDNSKLFAIKELIINYAKLKKILRKKLIKLFGNSVKKTISKYCELFDWKLASTEIKKIRSSVLTKYIKKNSLEKAAKLTETTRTKLKKILAESQGITISDKAKRIQKEIKNMKEQRAKTIARTETAQAINQTAIKSAESAKMQEKEWIHIGGRYTSRENHAKVNGVKVKLNDFFNLGNIQAYSPHDSRLPASEVINCNCLLLFW